jgi:hypothetical protein
MALFQTAASALRALPTWMSAPAGLAAACLIISGPGCSHKRSSMRPVYMGAPAAVAAPCNTPGGCGDSVGVSSGVTTVVPGESVSSPSSSVVEPSVGSIEPANPVPDSPPIAPRRGTTGEPSLDPKVAPSGGTSDNDAIPNINEPRPELVPPSAVRPTKRRTTAAKQRKTTLAETVRPLVNDPGDLFAPPKADRPWKYVVLHHSAHNEGGLDQIDREHRKALGFDGCGYHFVIGNGTDSPDGQIEVARRWSNQKGGVHTRNARDQRMNEDGIGICLVGDLDDKPPTPKQVASAKALVAYLSDHYKISADHIGTHADLSDSPAACPGKHFPSQSILGVRGIASR